MDEIDLIGEFEGSDLGDSRRKARLKILARSLANNPSASFPSATKTDAALEATYRLLGSESVSMDGILAGHYAQTAERAGSEELVLAIHDTSIFKFKGESARDGLGPVHGVGQGFYGHFTLLVQPGETRRPLGVIALQTWVRPVGGQAKSKVRGQSFEAARWKKGAAITEDRLAGRCALVHVMDREGDSYDLWAELLKNGSRFVIRNSRQRVLQDGGKLSDVIAGAKTIVERHVRLSRRRASNKFFNSRHNPTRDGRLARLALSAETTVIRRPNGCSKQLPGELKINFVHVREVGTHGSDTPVDWVIATTEPIGTIAEIERVVDTYRSRWVIEEYFKALKSGCEYEKRQLESQHTLSNALALFVPIAWQLLLFRSLARSTADAPATEALTPTQLEVLKAVSRKLPAQPTLRQALLAVAALGGHIKNNGEPGWAVLGRGFQQLLTIEIGWSAAKRCDQS